MLSFFQSDVRLSRPADAGVSHFRHWRDPMTIDVRGLAPLLNVFDMPTSIKFYCDGLGFEIALNDGKPAPHFDWVLLRLNESELMLNTAYEQDQRPPADCGRVSLCQHRRCPSSSWSRRPLYQHAVLDRPHLFRAHGAGARARTVVCASRIPE